MAMTPEGKVKQIVGRKLKQLGAYYFFPATGGYGRSGVPDIIGCLDGMFFGIECKAGKNKLTQLQMKNLRDIKKAGGVPMVVNDDNANDVSSELKRLILLTVLDKRSSNDEDV